MTHARLCVTVTGPTTEALRAARDAVSDADLVEIRLDSAERPDVRGVLAGRRLPVVLTCRPRWEGGAFDGSEDERHGLLAAALEAGAEYVDVEWKAGFDDLLRARAGQGVIVSSHEFDRTPHALGDRLREMRRTGAEVVKLAVQPQRLGDVSALLEAGIAAGPDEGRVLIAMGWRGLVTRVLPARFGSCWTYAGSLEAVGQISARRLVDEFRFRDIDPGTAVYGVVGSAAGHSLVPAMHNAGWRALGIDAVCVPFDATDADDFLDLAGRLAVRGVGVGAPYQAEFRARAAHVDEAAARLGLADTIRMSDDGLDATYLGGAGLPPDAGVRGCPAGDVLDRLVAHVARQCEWWFGRTPPAGVLRGAAERCRAAGEGTAR